MSNLLEEAASMLRHYLDCGYLPPMRAQEAEAWLARLMHDTAKDLTEIFKGTKPVAPPSQKEKP